MGVYVYKVTAKTKKLSNGEVANVAKFAYKPWGCTWEGEKRNNRLHFKTGCYVHDREAKKGKRSRWVTTGEEVYCLPYAVGSLYDSWMDNYYEEGVKVVE